MKVLKTFGNVLLDILIGFIGICFAFALYHYTSIKILDHPYTNFFGYTYFNIKTGSMASTINVDDYVFVKITKDVEIDDIISYVTEDEVITHRVIAYNEEEKTFITKGDANNAEDSPVKPEQVIGKVIKVGKGYGVVLKVITNWKILIPFTLAIVFLNLAFTNFKNPEKVKNKKEKQIMKKLNKEPKIKEGIVMEPSEEKIIGKSISDVLREKSERQERQKEKDKENEINKDKVKDKEK